MSQHLPFRHPPLTFPPVAGVSNTLGSPYLARRRLSHGHLLLLNPTLVTPALQTHGEESVTPV